MFFLSISHKIENEETIKYKENIGAKNLSVEKYSGHKIRTIK